MEDEKILHSPTGRGAARMGDESGDAIAHALPSKFYKDRRASRDEIRKRHEKYGYDPLDRALQSEKLELEKKKTMFGGMFEKKRTPQEEYEQNVKRLLRDHLDTMEKAGIVFHHTFTKDRLGFHVLIAKYGEEGRHFVLVDETKPHCEAYPSVLKPTDELIEVNGKLIMDPKDGKWFDALLKQISESKRPLKLTFIHGERRDEAFLEQEERRGMRSVDRPDASKSPLRGEAEQCARIAKLKLEEVKGAALSGDGPLAEAAKAKIDEQVSTCDGVAIDASKRVGDDRYAAHVKEVEETKRVTTEKLDECKAVAAEARALVKSLLAKLADEESFVDDAERFLKAAKDARIEAEDAANKGHEQTLRSAVADAVAAAEGAEKVEKEVDEKGDCFAATVQAVKTAAKKAAEERDRAEAAQCKFDAHKATQLILNKGGGENVRAASDDDEVFDASDLDDALARIAALRNRVRGDPNASEETRRAIDDAYVAVQRDREVAKAIEHAASAKAARKRAEDAAEKPDLRAALEAAADAKEAADLAKSVVLAAINEEEDDSKSEAVYDDSHKSTFLDAAKSAKSDHQVAEAAALAAAASKARDDDDPRELEDALRRLQSLRDRTRGDPEITEEARRAIADYARSATDDKNLSEAAKHADEATRAREAVERALAEDRPTDARLEANKAATAADQARKLRDEVLRETCDYGAGTKAAVLVAASTARDERDTAEAALLAAAAREGREDADAAAKRGDVDAARSAAEKVADASAKVGSIFAAAQQEAAKDAADEENHGAKRSDADMDAAAARLAAVGSHATSAAEDAALAEGAAAVAAAKDARRRAEDAVKKRDAALAAAAASDASRAAAKARKEEASAASSSAYSDATKGTMLDYARAAEAEATLATLARHEAAAAAGRKKAEDAVVEANLSKAEAGAAEAKEARAEAAEASAKFFGAAKEGVDDEAKKDVALAAGRAADHHRLAEAAKFEAASKAARKAAQKAADEGDPSKAEHASNDAVAAELGVVQLLGSLEEDAAASSVAACSAETKREMAAVAARTTEDRQLADAAKFSAMAAAGRRDAERAAKDENFEAAAAAASDALAGEEGLVELVSRVEMDSSISEATRKAIRVAAKKATEDRQAAEASELVAAAIQARKEAEKAALEPNAAKAEAFATAAGDAHAAVQDLQKQVSEEGPGGSSSLKSELEDAEKETLNQRFLAEAAKFCAVAKAARKDAESAAASGDMYAAEAAASDARTAEAGIDVLREEASATKKTKPATKKALDEAARLAKGARQIAEAAKCAALSAQARQEAKRCADEADGAPSAAAARKLAEVAGDSEETIEEALKQIQEILSGLRSDKGVSNETKVAIAKYAQPIIEDRHLAEAAKLAASAVAARREAEEAAERGDVDGASKARAKFGAVDHDVTQLLDLVESDRTLSKETKAAVADAAAKVAAERRVAEAAECAARAAFARGNAVKAAEARDLDAAEKFVAECRDADDIASAILEEAASNGSGDEVKAVKVHADRAKDDRLIAEGALVAARAKHAREAVEAAATVADNLKADRAKRDAKQAVEDINDLKAAANEDPEARSSETHKALGKYAAAVYDDAKAAAATVVPDKAQKAGEVLKKAAALAAAASAARKIAEQAASEDDDDAAGAKKGADDAQAAAKALDALETEVAQSGWYDTSTKQKVHDDATKAAEDAAKAAKAFADLLERRAAEAKRLAEEKEAADKKAADDKKNGLLAGALGAVSLVGGLFKKGDADDLDEANAAAAAAAKSSSKEGESPEDHFYGVTHSRFYMMPDSEEGVRLRDLAKAAAQEVAKALADTRQAVKNLKATSGQKHGAQGGADWKMNAINNAAAAVRRAQAKAKAVAELADEAAARAAKYKGDQGSSQKQTDRADATSSVVGGFSEVAQRDAKEADKLFRATHVIKPPVRRQGTRGHMFEKNAPVPATSAEAEAPSVAPSPSSQQQSRANGDTTALKGGGKGEDTFEETLDDDPTNKSGAATMQARQSNLMQTLGLKSASAAGGRAKREARSASAGVNEVTTSLAFKIPDREEGMKLRDLGKSYAEEAAKALADTKQAVKVTLDPESKARKNSVQAGSLWKMHALNNAAAAKTRARVAATKCAALAQQAKDRADRVKDEQGKADDVKAANATMTVVAGFSKSADTDANASNYEFEKTAVFKKRRDSDKVGDKA
eukprot:CAMPEP_0118890978 /NCGR_PEP_ID=MMETSP1166-20130328/1186_1 /TAXON_ID=1104430 /ORGANISM="Chrysoreinhardia sp, Strain CCMP3193" /LENGTH=2194 /DNA_ID=CAMNT_0006829611 /DNA_START=86 /DNA_END=6670 /DNA_ORIENTATION=+